MTYFVASPVSPLLFMENLFCLICLLSLILYIYIIIVHKLNSFSLFVWGTLGDFFITQYFLRDMVIYAWTKLIFIGNTICSVLCLVYHMSMFGISNVNRRLCKLCTKGIRRIKSRGDIHCTHVIHASLNYLPRVKFPIEGIMFYLVNGGWKDSRRQLSIIFWFRHNILIVVLL